MDEDHLRQCARYIGLKSRARWAGQAGGGLALAERADTSGGRADPLLTPAPLAERLGDDMARAFARNVDEEARRCPRRASSTGRPWGAAEWIKALEASQGHRLAEPKMGRPRATTAPEAISSEALL
jgi:putative transposase